MGSEFALGQSPAAWLPAMLPESPLLVLLLQNQKKRYVRSASLKRPDFDADQESAKLGDQTAV